MHPQAIRVELGIGGSQPRRFFFDLGNGSIRNAIAMQGPAALINDIFLSHLQRVVDLDPEVADGDVQLGDPNQV